MTNTFEAIWHVHAYSCFHTDHIFIRGFANVHEKSWLHCLLLQDYRGNVPVWWFLWTWQAVDSHSLPGIFCSAVYPSEAFEDSKGRKIFKALKYWLQLRGTLCCLSPFEEWKKSFLEFCSGGYSSFTNNELWRQ